MSKYEEYRHCQARGHASNGSWIASGGITTTVCKFCGTTFWTEEVHHEANVPDQPGQEQK